MAARNQKRELPDIAQSVEASPFLKKWVATRHEATERDFLLIMQDCAHQLAALHNFDGDPTVAEKRKGDAASLAILDADVTCFAATGRHLDTVKDYATWKAPDAPSPSAILRRFRTWKRAKACAGIGMARTNAATFLRSDGTRKTPIGFKWSLEARVRAVATWREHGCIDGMRGSSEDYIDFQQHRWPGLLPDYQRVTGRVKCIKRDGREGTTTEFSWQEMNRFAEDLAITHPEEFPVLAAHLRRQHQASWKRNGAVDHDSNPTVAA